VRRKTVYQTQMLCWVLMKYGTMVRWYDSLSALKRRQR